MLATFFGRNLSSSDFSFSQVTSVEKRESQQHFSASAYGLGLKKLCFGSLFSTSVTWEKLKSDEDKFFLRVGKHNYRNKTLFFLWLCSRIDEKLLKFVLISIIREKLADFTYHYSMTNYAHFYVL